MHKIYHEFYDIRYDLGCVINLINILFQSFARYNSSVLTLIVHKSTENIDFTVINKP